MYTIDSQRLVIFFLFCLFAHQVTMVNSNADEQTRLDGVARAENEDVRLVCDLLDVAWWKRPSLLATRYGMILARFRSRMSLERDARNAHVLHIRQLQSNDSGVYECETLGAIQQFNLTVVVRLASVELGTQLLVGHDLTQGTPANHSQPSALVPNNGWIHVRESQAVRVTCVVPRALPAASLRFPFDVDHHVERNATVENDDRTFRTILVLVVRVHRSFHKRSFHCQAVQSSTNDHGKQLRISSNTVHLDVAYSPVCSHKIPFAAQLYAGVRRAVNLTCHMSNGNPAKINFTWHLPNGNIHLGTQLNGSSSYLTLVPAHSTDFGQVKCRAQNELGLFGECHVNMILGAIPDPIESCHYTYLNSTLTVNCVVGYHQGDEDFFCYMYKRQQNGSYSEHARLKGNCAFILPDLKPEHHHDFVVFTKNKYGDNFDRSYSIKVGKPRVQTLAEKTRIYWPYVALLVLGLCMGSLALICCSCQRLRVNSSKKRKGNGHLDSLTYQNHDSHGYSNGKTSLVHAKQNGNGTTYPVRPYRSKDHLLSYDSSTIYRPSQPFKSIYTVDDEPASHRRSTFKETDLDRALNPPATPSERSSKTLPANRLAASASDAHPDSSSVFNPIPSSMQRRSSFQAATKLNQFDFSSPPESFYLLDKQLVKPTQRSQYSPERARDSSPHLKFEQSQLVVENTLLLNGNHELTDVHREYTKKLFSNSQAANGERHRDEGIFV